MSDEIYEDDVDSFEEEFVLNVNEVRMLLHHIDGNIHMVNMDEFNSLVSDMSNFCKDYDIVAEEVIED